MEHKKLIVKALKHFIQYNKNREEISLKYDEERRWISGLCAYVNTYASRELNLDKRDDFQIYENACRDFRQFINPYLNNGVWLGTRGKVTKRRLYVAQMIIKKLEKQLKRC